MKRDRAWFLVLVGFSFGLLSGANALPALLVEPMAVDFGEVFEHAMETREVQVINGGSEPITVSRVGRTCRDCLSTELDLEWLAPGEAAVLRITLCPDQTAGILEEMVTLESPGHDAVGIPVSAVIRPSYRMVGAPFLLEANAESDRLTTQVRITPQVPLAGRLESPGEGHGLFSVALDPDPRRTGSYIATLTTTSAIPVGMSELTIPLRSTDPGDPPCVIYGSVFLPPPIHVYPARLRIAPAVREQLRILFVDQRKNPPANILEVRVPDEHVRWEFMPGFSLEQIRINVYIDRQEGKEGPLGDLVLITDDPENPAIRVPIVVDPSMAAPSVSMTGGPVPVANPRGCGCVSSM